MAQPSCGGLSAACGDKLTHTTRGGAPHVQVFTLLFGPLFGAADASRRTSILEGLIRAIQGQLVAGLDVGVLLTSKWCLCDPRPNTPSHSCVCRSGSMTETEVTAGLHNAYRTALGVHEQQLHSQHGRGQRRASLADEGLPELDYRCADILMRMYMNTCMCVKLLGDQKSLDDDVARVVPMTAGWRPTPASAA
jgi:hypothetical protein